MISWPISYGVHEHMTGAWRTFRKRTSIAVILLVVLLPACSTSESSDGLPSEADIVLAEPAFRLDCDEVTPAAELSELLGRNLQVAAVGHYIESGYSQCQYGLVGGNLSISYEIYSGTSYVGDVDVDARSRLDEELWTNGGGPFPLEVGDWGISGVRDSSVGLLPMAIVGVNGLIIWVYDDADGATEDDDVRALAALIANRLESVAD